MPVPLQEKLIADLNAGGAGVEVRRCQAGHEPAISQREGTWDIIMEFVDGVASGL